ncbi:MAG: hypothetical protein NT013_29925 [Planctomycetia bacterium]|nr:hypothetical protein [Planctomycetia bacterium]
MIDGLTSSAIWLLKIVVDCYCPLRLIALSEPGLRAQWLRPGHGLDRDELVKTLLMLQQQGDICFYRRPDDERSHEVLDETQLRDCLILSDLNQGYVYGLTGTGAARWERFAEPNWSRFASWVIPDDNLLEVIAGSKVYLDELMANVDVLSQDPIVPTSIVEDVLTPWDATYWKQLSCGYRVRCQTIDLNQNLALLEQSLKRWRGKTWADVDRQCQLHRWVRRISYGELFWRQPGK